MPHVLRAIFVGLAVLKRGSDPFPVRYFFLAAEYIKYELVKTMLMRAGHNEVGTMNAASLESFGNHLFANSEWKYLTIERSYLKNYFFDFFDIFEAY